MRGRKPRTSGCLRLCGVVLAVSVLACLLVVSLGFVAPAEAATVNLAWNPNTESDLSGYKIYQSTVSGKYGPPVATLGKVTSHTLTLPQLTVDATYYFRITSYDLAGNESIPSSEVNKVIAGIPVPPAVPSPTNFRYELGSMKWDAVSQAVGGYLLRVHEAGTSYDPCESMLYCNVGVGTLTDPFKALPFKPNTSYDAWVHGLAADGTWGPSQGLSFVTPAQIHTALATLQGAPATEAWAVEISTTVSAPYTVDVYVNDVLDHSESSAPFCSWGNDAGSPCTRLVKPAGSYTIQFRVMVGAVELARTSMVVVVPDAPPAQPQGLTISSITPDEIVITAMRSNCVDITASQKVWTPTTITRTIRCVR